MAFWFLCVLNGTIEMDHSFVNKISDLLLDEKLIDHPSLLNLW
jgi:hypothetical protein